LQLIDREGSQVNFSCGFPECPVTSGNYLCYETDVIPFNVEDDSPSKALGSRLPRHLDFTSYPIPPAGQFVLYFQVAVEQQLRPSANGLVFIGLPATGFAATNYINANVTPGVLSNYSAVYPHRSTASCTNSTNPQSACQ